MEQEREQRRKRAKISIVVLILLPPFIMAIVGITNFLFSPASNWKTVLAYSLTCSVIWIISMYISLRWYSRYTRVTK